MNFRDHFAMTILQRGHFATRKIAFFGHFAPKDILQRSDTLQRHNIICIFEVDALSVQLQNDFCLSVTEPTCHSMINYR